MVGLPRIVAANRGRATVRVVGIVVSPDGARAFVAHTSADAVAVFDLADGKTVEVLRAGREPDGMAFSPVLVRAGR